MSTIFLDAIEHATILAALRFWRDHGGENLRPRRMHYKGEAADLVDLATAGGELPLMDEDEVEDLAQRLHREG